MSVSLLEVKANFIEWCKAFLNTHVEYRKDMPFDIDFVAETIWHRIKNDYENFLFLQSEDAALRERLDRAVELPTIYEHIIYPFIEESYTETIYYVVYKENGRIMTTNCGKNKAAAEARLKELQGGSGEEK